MLNGYRHRFALVAVLVLAILAPASLFAAAVGQIKGTITDKESGEPVVGASVLIVGTTRGAMTDFDGKYMIRQVEPGTYTLRVSHLDYKTVDITEVQVNADLTTEQNMAMTKSVSELDEKITVVGDRDVLEVFEVSNQATIDKETIERKPVTTVDELLGQVAGVVTNTQGEVFIRGGRAGEISYIVDGVAIGDPLGGLGQAGAQLSLVSGSIQEFTVIKDGFDPEYGDALSGIVKITTQTGSKDNTRINSQFITDDFGNETLNKYSRNNDYFRFSVSGPDPFLKSKLLPALGINWLEDKELTYYFYGEIDKSDGIYQYDDFDTDLTTHRARELSVLGIDVPERLNNKYYYMTNIKFRPRQDLKMILSYKNSSTDRTVFDWDFRYSPNTAPVQESWWNSLSLEMSQTLARNMNYEAVISFTENGIRQQPGDPSNPGRGIDPSDIPLDSEWETYEDRNGNGVYDAPEPVINLFPDTTSYGLDYTGAAYTYGEYVYSGGAVQSLPLPNNQAGVQNYTNFRFNDNLILDSLEGEAFIDINGNGVWDAGDYLQDKNGNGILDAARDWQVDVREPEPFVNGDSVIGEPFTDINGNGVYDEGIDGFDRVNDDLNHNGDYDGPGVPGWTPNQWVPGIPFEDRNGNGLFDNPNENTTYDPGEPFVDLNGNGIWDPGGSASFLRYGSYDQSMLWHYHNTRTWTSEFKMFWQLGNHELKAGFATRFRDFEYQEIIRPYSLYNGRPDGGPYPNRGSFRDMFAYKPWGGYLYMRDKLEYGSMIASLGFRWDFFIQDTDRLIPIAEQDDLGSGIILGDRQKISPRIGFSYPISDKAKVHFNYGHFYQLPDLQRMYARNTASITENTVIGNYNLDYKKTVQYSFGVKYAMSDYYSLDLSGYFKDEFDKINSYVVRVGGLEYQQYRNTDYGRSRGFEVTLEKRGGGYVNGMLSYTYAFAYGKASQSNENYLSDFELSREPLDEAPLDHDVRHSLVGNIQFYVPRTVKPRLFGLPIPNGWSLSIETLIQSGRPFTPSDLYPGIDRESGEDIQRNSLRMPSVVNFDIRFTKEFKFVGMDYSFIVWVENIFDNKNVAYVYPATGRPDTQQNIDQVIFGGTAYDSNPAHWDYGRQIRVGLEVNL